MGQVLKIEAFKARRARKKRKPELLKKLFDFLHKTKVQFDEANQLRRGKDDETKSDS